MWKVSKTVATSTASVMPHTTWHTQGSVFNGLGRKLRVWRATKFGYQRNLADELHIRRETVCRWERGKQFPDGRLLVKLLELGFII